MPASGDVSEAKLKDSSGIHVQEMDVQLEPEVENAVMLYANGRTGDATAALNRYILDHPDSGNPQPWYLLFDIYEVMGQRQPFEEMALDFAVRFERSPPTWRPVQAAKKGEAEPKFPSFVFTHALSPQDKARLEHFLLEAKKAETVGLDFSKSSVPDDDYARIMLDTLSTVVAMGKEIHLQGGEGFVVRLNASRASGHLTETTWLLLLMLIQLLGRPDQFDDAAVEYAIRFEMSPPSYTPNKHVRTGTEEEVEETAEPFDHTFPMQGILGSNSAGLFESLRKFAEPLPRVEIDISQVPRIDFTVVGLLMDAVMALAMAGKQIVFKGGNGMVNLLLQMIGIGQFATILSENRK